MCKYVQKLGERSVAGKGNLGRAREHYLPEGEFGVR